MRLGRNDLQRLASDLYFKMVWVSDLVTNTNEETCLLILNETKRRSALLAKINSNYVVSLDGRITISSNSRLVSIKFFVVILDHFIISFGITVMRIPL